MVHVMQEVIAIRDRRRVTSVMRAPIVIPDQQRVMLVVYEPIAIRDQQPVLNVMQVRLDNLPELLCVKHVRQDICHLREQSAV